MEKTVYKDKEVYETIKDIEEACNTMLKYSFNWKFWDFKHKVRFKIFPDFTFNARAYKGVFVNSIGVNFGVLPLIYALSINYAKLDYVGEFLGNVKYDVEAITEKMKKILATCWVTISRHDIDDSTISSFYDSEGMNDRETFAYSMYKKMLYFFILHEYSHILCNHHNKYSEFDTHYLFKVDKHKNEQSQWQELEADLYGSILLCEVMRFDVEKISEDKCLDDIYNELGVIYQAIGLLLLAFAFANPLAETIDSYMVTQHPHPAIRIAHTFENLTWYLGRRFHMKQNILKKIMTKSLTNVMTLAYDLEMPLYYILTNDTNRVINEIQRIRQTISEKIIKDNQHKINMVILAMCKKMSFF